MAAEARGGEFRDVLRVAVSTVRGAADALRYAEVVLGLVFLRYLSATFEFSVPPNARWSWIEDHARLRGAGRVLDQAVAAVEFNNPDLTGILTGVFGRDDIDQARLADLVDLLSARWASYELLSATLGEEFSLFLDGFARFEGKLGSEFHTPRSVTRLILEILEPYSGRVYDPACGAADMLAQVATSDALVYGQERDPRTWNLARMNLIVHGVHTPELGAGSADTLGDDDQHPELRADFVMAHPPLNARLNYAWLQLVTAKLAPRGTAAVVMPSGSLHARWAEGEIRRRMVEGVLVACIIALPNELFPATGIPACLWVLDKNKADRWGQILFIDATGTGTLVSKTERVLEDADLARIANTYRAWAGTGAPYADEPGFCFSASLETVRANQYSLNPGLYVTPGPPDLMQNLYAIFEHP